MLFQQPEGRRPERILLVIDTTPETTVMEVGGRTKVFLRNLRYLGAAGLDIHHYRCADCGWSGRLAATQARPGTMSVCPQCKSRPSTCECSMWHTYGHCEQCTEVFIEPIPFPDRQDKSVVDSVAHVG